MSFTAATLPPSATSVVIPPGRHEAPKILHESSSRLPALLPLTSEFDPRFTEYTGEHQAYMERKLYGHERDNRVLPQINAEAGDYRSPYADEEPPPWETTMKTDFPRRNLAGRAQPNLKIAQEIARTHFTLEGPEEDDGSARQHPRSHIDYGPKPPLEKVDGKLIQKGYNVYPPIFRDIEVLNHPRGSTYDSAYHLHPTKRRIPIPHKHTRTNIVLGTDGSPTYVSSMRDATQAPGEDPTPSKPRTTPDEDDKREWTFAMEDGEKEQWASLSSQSYKDPVGVDYTAKRPNWAKASGRAHFSLGNSTATDPATSTYSYSFRAAVAENGERPTVAKSYVPSSVLDEHDADGDLKQSMYMESYGLKDGINGPAHKHAPQNIIPVASSVVFGSAGPDTLTSTTRTAFTAPSSSGSPIRHPGAPTDTPHLLGSPFDLPTATPTSSTRSAYATTPDASRLLGKAHAQAVLSRRTAAKAFRGSRVFGSGQWEGDIKDCQREDMIAATKAQEAHRLTGKRAAGVPSGVKSGEGWNAKGEANDWTTTSQTLGRFPPVSPSSIKAAGELTQAARGLATRYRNRVLPEGLIDGSTSTTVMRSSYVPPVRMRYLQPVFGVA
ncbi:uncharacterized protein EV422DRAFT_568588 [Fimicolochytrium jonesii]|uniref:uncharacterized protein n=1 Tax=Fimicolochytrium jonesii TaxID=1396493 RepID=UPI0022FE0E92|nr:uncharacterized protein EV422DRAFT_568588 [Fimicolochytrium jonesii]KAI8819626.1 hypothetical protein EV422DRAFT_568588 [Fimicolochytrium jonesii]